MAMQLIVAKLREPNFGDELNAWMWPRLLPRFFDDDPSVIFVGIGSTLNSRLDGPRIKIVVGAGHAPEYGGRPDLSGGDWRVYFVRGPRTAAALGLDPALAVGDPAILVRTLIDPARRDPRGVSFMPHWESLGWGLWPAACDMAGVNLIDPRRPAPEVLDEILRSTVVVTEAMHGAIVSDALRIPWVAMRPLNRRHRPKWDDWAQSLAMETRPRPLFPSSLVELLPNLTRRLPVLGAARDAMASWPLTPARAATIRLAAACLRQAAASPPRLSADARLDAATDRMLAALDLLKRHRREGRFPGAEIRDAGPAKPGAPARTLPPAWRGGFVKVKPAP